MTFEVVECTSYDPENGFNKWYELQPQYDDEVIYVNLENINEYNR